MRAAALLLALLLLPACARSPSATRRRLQPGAPRDVARRIGRGAITGRPGCRECAGRQQPGLALAFSVARLSGRDSETRLSSGGTLSSKLNFQTGPAFDGLRARQQWLAAYLQVEQGNAKAGHEALVAARQLGAKRS